MQSYLFFGPPGSGKGTQKDLLANEIQKKHGDSFVVIETGELLREFTKEKDTATKQQLADIMESGGLVPSAFPISGWVGKLIHETKEYKHIIVDGAGRKLIEAKVIVELLKFFPDSDIHIIYLKVHDEEVINRLLKRGRSDDKIEVIQNRLTIYKDRKTETTASINFLKKNKDVIFHTVDGIGTIEEVHKRICDTLTL